MNNYFKNIKVNSLSTLWSILFQIFSVPIFLTYWDASKYGEWIVLNSIVVIFQMSDIGINTASLNAFVINYQKKNFLKCKKIFTNNFVIITVIFLIIFLIFLFFYFSPFLDFFLKFRISSNQESIKCILILFIYTYLGTIANSISAIYSATGKYSRGVIIDNISRMSEGVFVIISVINNASILNILQLNLLIRVIFLTIKVLDSNKLYKLEINLVYFDIKELKKIILPSFAFFTIPISNTLIYQGFTFIVYFYFGSSFVVLYSTSRTLINIIKSISDIITKSVWPDVSYSFAKNNFKMLRLYHSRICMYSFIIFLFSSIFLLFFSKIIFINWTVGKSEYDIILIILLLVAMLGNLIQSSSSVILQATNQHTKYVIQYFIFYSLGLITAFVIVRLFHNFSFIAIGLVIPEVLLCFYVFRKTIIISNDTFNFFIKRLKIDFFFHYNLIRHKS
jgi:O-antigen/teichoic acid export membrane protein